MTLSVNSLISDSSPRRKTDRAYSSCNDCLKTSRFSNAIGRLPQMCIRDRDLAMDLARAALLRGKKVVAFDDLRIVETGLPMDKVYCPVVRKEHMPGNRFGKLYRCPKPVLGIFGTSSRQGKFTLQLYLRKELGSVPSCPTR